MTSVDFYILPDNSVNESDYQLFACRLTEKALSLGNQVYIQVDDVAQANQLNTLLWTFRDISFVPHQLENETNIASPVVIGWRETFSAAVRPDLLINLSMAIPAFYDKFDRIAEIVSEPEQRRQMIRQHYSHYKKAGLSLDTHQM